MNNEQKRILIGPAQNVPLVTADRLVSNSPIIDADDAIYIRMMENGFRAHVSLCDTDYYVPIGSPEDILAQKKIYSDYSNQHLNQVDHMIKGVKNIALKAGQVRKTVTCVIDFTKAGNIKSGKFFLSETTVASNYGFNLETQHNKAINNLIANAKAFFRAKGINIEDWSDNKVIHKLVYTLMIATNSLCGKLLAEKNYKCLYRVCEEDENQKQALFSTKPAQHKKMQETAYAKITDSIRSYPGLIVLRILKAAIMNAENPYTEEDLQAWCDELNKAYWKTIKQDVRGEKLNSSKPINNALAMQLTKILRRSVVST